jgi:hypothetical protein
MLLHSQFWSGVEGSMILNSNTHLPANKLKDDEDLTPVNTSYFIFLMCGSFTSSIFPIYHIPHVA